MKRRRFSPLIYAAIIIRQVGFCACGCGEPLGADPRDIEFDHIVPLHHGGADAPENLQALRKRHHLGKSKLETKARAKEARIRERGGMMKRRLNARDKALAKILGGTP